MKTFIALLAIVALQLSAADITLVWDQSPDADMLKGTRVDVETTTGELFLSLTVPKEQTSITFSLTAGRYRSTVTFIGDTTWTTNDVTGEVWTTNLVTDSAPSNPVMITVPGHAPKSRAQGKDDSVTVLEFGPEQPAFLPSGSPGATGNASGVGVAQMQAWDRIKLATETPPEAHNVPPIPEGNK